MYNPANTQKAPDYSGAFMHYYNEMLGFFAA